MPPFNLGGQDMYSVSPDGQELAYTSNIDEVEATSTNNEIFLVPMAGGTPKKISTSPGNDNTPLYSPDGKHIAWRSMARAGFEADKESLIIYQRRARAELRNADDEFRSFGRLPDMDAGFKADFFHRGRPRRGADLRRLPLDAKQPSEVRAACMPTILFSPKTESRFFSSRVSIRTPNEIWKNWISRSPIELGEG